jgi:SAM-dependent methyltransferase
MLKSLIYFFKSYPLNVSVWKIKCRILGIKISHLEEWQKLVNGKKGVEIGGPSGTFNSTGYLPLYPIIANLDGINFSNTTLWEGEISEGNHYDFEGRKGYQFIAEGSDIPMIEDGTYDFVLSCNNLEHIANPLRTIIEWKRIIRINGVILLVLPNKHSNFDHRRSFTSFDHLLMNYEKNTLENDLSHLEEILKYHDLKCDPRAGTVDQFRKRCLNNVTNRAIHHHVFDQGLLRQVLEFAGLEIALQFSSPTDHYVAAIKKQV